MSTSNLFVIVETNYTSENVLFWRPNRAGYTTDLNQAGVYSEDEARRIGTLRDGTYAVPRDEAMRAARRVLLVSHDNREELIKQTPFQRRVYHA